MSYSLNIDILNGGKSNGCRNTDDLIKPLLRTHQQQQQTNACRDKLQMKKATLLIPKE
jgi:hypothetical protein